MTLADAGSLPTGLIGRVQIATHGVRATISGNDVLAIPAEALVEGAGDHGVVFTLDPDARSDVPAGAVVLFHAPPAEDPATVPVFRSSGGRPDDDDDLDKVRSLSRARDIATASGGVRA